MNIALAAASFAALIAGAFALAPSGEIATETQIDASPEQVWSVLGDPASYAEWNPTIVSMKGELVEGARLTNTLKRPDGKEMTFRPIVLKAEPAKELRWLGRLFLPRIFDGEHYFKLEERNGGTRLVHGEKFRGILLWFMGVEQFRADFEALNAALKARAEQPA